jgi:hypothetical protein
MFRVSTLAACAAALALSQAPEFEQQYSQRLGGAIGELEPIVANFDADAQRASLSRAQALEIYGRSHEQFLRDRGKSMVEVFDRYDRLVRQRATLLNAGPLSRPALAMYSADMKLLTDTRRSFAPALPLSLAGLIYAALGFALVLAIRGVGRRARRLFRRLRYASNI